MSLCRARAGRSTHGLASRCSTGRGEWVHAPGQRMQSHHRSVCSLRAYCRLIVLTLILDTLDTLTLVLPRAGHTRVSIRRGCKLTRTNLSSYFFINATNRKRVFILGPSHHVYLNGCALSRHDEYDTPLGRLPLDRESEEAQRRRIGFLFTVIFIIFSYRRAQSNGIVPRDEYVHGRRRT